MTKQMVSRGWLPSHGGQPLTEGHEDLPCPWTSRSGSWFPRETSTGLSGLSLLYVAVSALWVQAAGPQPVGTPTEADLSAVYPLLCTLSPRANPPQCPGHMAGAEPPGPQ